MLRIGIMDDEQIYREKHYHIVKQVIETCGIEANIKCYNEMKNTFDELHLELMELDILFLDIELGDENGVHVARYFDSLKSKAIIVFVTSHDKYMLESFGLNIYKFILKEQANEKIPEVLNSLIARLFSGRLINLKTENGLCTFNTNEIIYIEICNRKIHMITNSETIQLYYTTLRQVAELFSEDFILVNSSTIVNLKNVESYEKGLFILAGKVKYEVSVTRGKAKKVNEIYKQYLYRKIKQNVL